MKNIITVGAISAIAAGALLSSSAMAQPFEHDRGFHEQRVGIDRGHGEAKGFTENNYYGNRGWYHDGRFYRDREWRDGEWVFDGILADELINGGYYVGTNVTCPKPRERYDSGRRLCIGHGYYGEYVDTPIW